MATPTTGTGKLRRFGNYEILYELKHGGMGSVLLARRRGPGAFEQLVAIKTIRAEYATAAAVRAMFLDEAAILARLSHPGVATVHDFGEEAGTLYMVMEYVAGIPFRELLELHPPPAVVARAIAEACRGLHAAHEVRDLAGNPMGLVHRDISPDNLMLGFDGHVKVIDFGIALVKNRQAPVTEFGTVKGKPPYMSPEQVKNEPMDRKSDVWSLAIVLWELLTNQQLFDEDSIYAVAYAVENKAIPPPSQARGETLPLGLDAAVMNALDRDLERRTPTAAAFAEELEQVVQAAGGETLEAWAERALAASRDQHRKWLAQIVSAQGQLPRMVGRSTHEVTELGAEVAAALPAQPVAAEAASVPSPKTSIGGTAIDEPLDVVQPRRLAPLVAFLLAALITGGVVLYVMRERQAGSPAPAQRDAAVIAQVPSDAPPVVVMTPPDAAPVIPVIVVDAGVPVVPPLDAGHRHVPTVAHDAAAPIAPAPPDAAPIAPPPPAGEGYLIAKHKAGGTYLNVIVDGKQIGTTPMLGTKHKLAAGKHTVELVSPDTGAVVVHEVVDVQPDKPIEVAQP